VKRALLTLYAFASIALVAGCGGDDDDAAPPATVGTVTTSTTLSVEQEVEAAYLRSWDVYTEAMRTFDTSQLKEVYIGEALALRLDEVGDLEAANTPARMSVEHDYEITVDGETAVVVDAYVNHSVLVDPMTGEPTEADPNNRLTTRYEFRKVGDTWRIERVLVS
jgi:hypothetical protein